MTMTTRPIAMPIGSTRTESRSVTSGGGHGADRDAERDHALQVGRLRQVEAEVARGPVDHDELQRRAGAPEQRRRRERDLAELVAPQQVDAVRELADQRERVAARRAVVDAGVGMNQLNVAAIA
jgi:hypothetical protein